MLNVPKATNNANHPILREVEAAVKSLKKGKSAGMGNIPAELLQQGGEAMVNTLLIICNKIWWTRESSTPRTRSLVIILPKNGNSQLCQNYRTTSRISHPSKVMLKIILNRLKPEAEKIIAEEQADFAQDAALQSRYSTSGYFVRGTSGTNRTSIMFLLTSKRHSTGCGTQHFGQL